MDFLIALAKNIHILGYFCGGLKFVDIQLGANMSLFSKVIAWFRSLRNILSQFSLETIDVSILFQQEHQL